jgi:capsule polysaccharide export protein KpsE/RkpR
MAQQSLVDTGVESVRSVVHDANRRIQKLQKQIDVRRKSVEKELSTRRRRLEQRTQKAVDRLVARAQKLPLVKRAATLREEASRQIESGVETVLGVFQIASRGELERIDRKLSQISRKLRELEKGIEEPGV